MGKYGKGLYANVLRDFLSNGYKKDQAKSLDGFQRDESLSGQRVQVYNKPDTKQTVVVHRGTQGFQDVLTDIKLAFHPSLYMKSNRFQHAKAIQEQAENKYGKENVTTVGHSLGAKLAADVGGKSKEIITYNKPIIPQEILKQTRKNETSIRTKMDPVSILGSFNPNIKQVSTKTMNPIAAHATTQLGEIKNEFVGAGESDGLKKVLSNFDLFRIAQEKGIQLRDVIAKDEIKKLKRNGNYIINLENHNQGGSHWTALILGKKNCLYCDSFGMPPPEQLYLFLEKKYKKVDFSRKEIQDMDSTLCGYFCKFMKEHPNGTLVNNLQQYQNLYSENTKENDAILAKLFLS